MVVMALDHCRDYFHAAAFLFDPADPQQSTLPIFFTRWITHFCAPGFSFLAGMSAFMMGRRKDKIGLSRFLLSRGIWLIIIEMTIVNFAWFFDVGFRSIGLLTIWSLGVSMVALAALVHLPKTVILLFSCILIFGHNLLDNIHFNGSMLWGMLHKQIFYPLPGNRQLLIGYPVIPWIAVMALGYYFGSFYNPAVGRSNRRFVFNIIGVSSIVLFVLLRFMNWYGDPVPFTAGNNVSQSLISFLNPSKYPPSLQYLLMTLGPTFIFLANAEKLKGWVVEFFATFGRVPFFYYILHLYLIHILAMLVAHFSGFGWQKLVLSTWVSFDPGMKGFGFHLWVVYAVWIFVIALLYPLCKKFDKYKQAHRKKWWLSYL